VLTYGACYAAFYGGRPPIEVPFLTRLARSLDLPDDVRVLDIGCGTGRLLGPLAALGWHVVGMDPHPENVDEARRVAPGTPGVDIIPGGFGDLEAVEAFDMVVAVADPWWYLLTAAERADALERVRRALGPRGVVVLEGPNFEWILDHYLPPANPTRRWWTASESGESHDTTSTVPPARGPRRTSSPRRKPATSSRWFIGSRSCRSTTSGLRSTMPDSTPSTSTPTGPPRHRVNPRAPESLPSAAIPADRWR
jgi:SAM-dependent methyltransferase